jgi:hypothetical protein
MMNCFQVLLSNSTCAAAQWPDSYWDDWMRLQSTRRGRESVRPEVCRTFNFGEIGSSKVRRCKLNPVEAHVERVWFQRLKLNCDDPLSNVALNVNVRLYTKGQFYNMYLANVRLASQTGSQAVDWSTQNLSYLLPGTYQDATWAGRCRLIVTKSELKARLVSALET